MKQTPRSLRWLEREARRDDVKRGTFACYQVLDRVAVTAFEYVLRLGK